MRSVYCSALISSICLTVNLAIADDKLNSGPNIDLRETRNPQTILITETQIVSISFESLEVFQQSLNSILSESLPLNVYQPIAADL